jgi:transcriptional regulator with XRE-family HTH domain
MPRGPRATATTGGVVRRAIFGAGRQQRAGGARVAGELRALRQRAGLSQAAVARSIGVDRSVICRLEQASLDVSLSVIYRAAALLGASIRIGVFPDAQPVIHDAAHARLVEALLGTVHRSWQVTLEAPIPGRPGASSDARFDRADDVVLIEVESRVGRLEEILREVHAKQAAVTATVPGRSVHVVLVLPPTPHNRELVREHRATMSAAFPAASRTSAPHSAARAGPGRVMVSYG